MSGCVACERFDVLGRSSWSKTMTVYLVRCLRCEEITYRVSPPPVPRSWGIRLPGVLSLLRAEALEDAYGPPR